MSCRKRDTDLSFRGLAAFHSLPFCAWRVTRTPRDDSTDFREILFVRSIIPKAGTDEGLISLDSSLAGWFLRVIGARLMIMIRAMIVAISGKGKKLISDCDKKFEPSVIYRCDRCDTFRRHAFLVRFENLFVLPDQRDCNHGYKLRGRIYTASLFSDTFLCI
jgi:hypothetical protein